MAAYRHSEYMGPQSESEFLSRVSGRLFWRDLLLQVRDWRAIFRGFTGVSGCGTKVQECPEIMEITETGTNSTHHTPTLQIWWWCLSCESDFIVTFIKFHFLSPVFFRFKLDPTCGRSAVFNSLEPPPRGFSRWKLRTMAIMMTQMTRCGICYGAHGRFLKFWAIIWWGVRLWMFFYGI